VVIVMSTEDLCGKVALGLMLSLVLAWPAWAAVEIRSLHTFQDAAAATGERNRLSRPGLRHHRGPGAH